MNFIIKTSNNAGKREEGMATRTIIRGQTAESTHIRKQVAWVNEAEEHEGIPIRKKEQELEDMFAKKIESKEQQKP